MNSITIIVIGRIYIHHINHNCEDYHKMKTIAVFHFLMILPLGVNYMIGEAEYLFRDLFQNYTTQLRPVLNQSNTVSINMSIDLISINYFEEVSGILELSTMIFQTWKDERLQWNPDDYSELHTLSLAPSSLWTPRVTLSTITDNTDTFDTGNTKLRVSYNGDISWLKYGVIKTTCIPNVKRFPFDIQTCRFNFVLVGYNADEIIINVPEKKVGTTFNHANGIWEVTNTLGIGGIIEHPFLRNMHVSYAAFSLELKRKPTFFVVTLLVPAFILLFVNPLVFLLPVESGERISFAMSTFLSFTVFISITYGVMPRRSEPMSSLLIIFTLSFIVSAMIIFGALKSITVYHRHLSYPIHPLYSCLCRPTIIKLCSIGIDPEEDQDQRQQKRPPIELDETFKNKNCKNSLENSQTDLTIQLGWKNISKVLDVLFFIFFILIDLVIVFVFAISVMFD